MTLNDARSLCSRLGLLGTLEAVNIDLEQSSHKDQCPGSGLGVGLVPVLRLVC